MLVFRVDYVENIYKVVFKLSHKKLAKSLDVSARPDALSITMSLSVFFLL